MAAVLLAFLVGSCSSSRSGAGDEVLAALDDDVRHLQPPGPTPDRC